MILFNFYDIYMKLRSYKSYLQKRLFWGKVIKIWSPWRLTPRTRQMSKTEDDRPQNISESKEQGSPPAMSSSASTQAIASIASYCLANMAMTVTNKYVFSVPPPPFREACLA